MNLRNVFEAMARVPGVDWFEIHEIHALTPYFIKHGTAGASDEWGHKVKHYYRVILCDGKHPAVDAEGEKPLDVIVEACKKIGLTLPQAIKRKMTEPKLI